ncbi:MAG: NTP transferase domain-containing protein [Propionibacteriaceae bacterium]
MVLAGGESRRFGSDKLSALLAGETLLDHVVAGLPADWAVIVVGPERSVGRAVRFVREDPPGGGPTAALVSGLRAAQEAGADQIMVLPGDAPAAGPAAVRMYQVLQQSPSVEAIVGVDATGFEQPLQLALRRPAASALVAFAGESGGHNGRARTLVNRLQPPALRVTLSAEDHFDIDTPDQLATWAARDSSAVQQILTAVDALDISGRPVVVALDGRSGAGKTTLAAGLSLVRPATVVEGDDFYGGRQIAGLDFFARERLPDAEVADLVIDWRRLRREALEPLSGGNAARFARYDWDSDDGRMGAEVGLVAADLVVVEGVYSARPELSDLVDLAVCVEVDPSVRQRRLSLRADDDDPHLVSFWERGESFYFAEVRPVESFDLVVGSTEEIALDRALTPPAGQP